MIYSGSAISVAAVGDGIAELKLDLSGEKVNKLNQATLQEFDAATQAIVKDGSVKGVIVTSGKAVFIVGADITEFGGMFARGEESIARNVLEVDRMFSRFEDLPVPLRQFVGGPREIIGLQWHPGRRHQSCQQGLAPAQRVRGE